MKKQWHILQPDIEAVEKICALLKCSPLTAAILVNRKIDSEETAARFMEASLGQTRPPFSLKGMDAAVRRIHSAVIRNEKILIFGDYDADGVTATALLFEFFKQLGADVSYYIPHRIKEGYSLKSSHISDYALPHRIDLIITADCGSGSNDAIETAQQSGIDVVVTDHHKISEHPPPAAAVINPNRHDCVAGFEHLSGVGVAFCLLICLRKHLRDLNFWKDRTEPNLRQLCDLVAIGTVADIVPLILENRIFTKTGLAVINSGTRQGINALIKESRINRMDTDAEDIAFRLAPRINAAGRMDHAGQAVELLTTQNTGKALQIARNLNQLNTKRQAAEQKLIDDIQSLLEAEPHLLEGNAIVLARRGWYEGVLGIAASRIVAKYFRPVILLAISDGIGKGSGRSIPGFDLYQGLSACTDDLENFGGHPMAAGLSIKAENIDRFTKSFAAAVQKLTRPDDFVPTITIDAEIRFDDISPELIDEIETLQPFGSGNREPLFMSKNIEIVSSKIVGGRHRRMMIKQSDSWTGQSFQAIHFNINPDEPAPESFDKIAFRLRWNRWNGNQNSQMIIEETENRR